MPAALNSSAMLRSDCFAAAKTSGGCDISNPATAASSMPIRWRNSVSFVFKARPFRGFSVEAEASHGRGRPPFSAAHSSPAFFDRLRMALAAASCPAPSVRIESMPRFARPCRCSCAQSISTHRRSVSRTAAAAQACVGWFVSMAHMVRFFAL